MRFLILLVISCFLGNNKANCQAPKKVFIALNSPILFKGDLTSAYRDPAVLYHKKKFFLFFTLVRVENDDKVYSYTAMSTSKNLRQWSKVKILTPRDQYLNYSSPGNVIRYKKEWVLCLQTYPRPDYYSSQMPRFGTDKARIFTIRSKNLRKWTSPQLLKVKGKDVSEKEMGRMIDPYLLADKSEKGKWWCFYKQNGVSMSYSHNLSDWTYFGRTESGENVCVLVENDEYILLHSLKNGMAIKRSKDLKNWQDWGGLITLGQSKWNWAKGRITAGVLINLKNVPRFGKYIMFFHGSGPLTENKGDFDKNAYIGIAWSEDLINWDWPGKK